jgi:peroxiredoxin
MLKRIKPQRVFDALSYDAVIICEQFGWANAEEVIIAYLESSGRLPDDPANLVNRAILQGKVKIGDKAPKLDGEVPVNALLIFYESGCTHCQHQLAELTQHYSEITEKGIRVISISTDESKEVYEYHSKAFPWPDKRCDFQGFKGENLKNYGVVGTPTIYLIDEKGIIIDRQPRLENIKALNLYPPAPVKEGV